MTTDWFTNFPVEKNIFDEEHIDEHGECKAEIDRLNARIDKILKELEGLCNTLYDVSRERDMYRSKVTAIAGLLAAITCFFLAR